ncbi:MAG: aminoacetone oxidase family FAD-binding enzyme [Candidatus Gastranaerophilaceae bacterium]
MKREEKSVAIIGAGPAGCICACSAQNNPNVSDVVLFDFAEPLHTLLYTGGGRCNLAYAEYDFKELAKFYPRGEKFLYSVFSRFSTADTIDFFKKIGVETYTQDDLRIFPTSNSAKSVREKMLENLRACRFKKEKVVEIKKQEDKFLITTENNEYCFDKVVLAIGGHAGFSLAKNLGHRIIEPKPALTGLISAENFKNIQGVSLKNVKAEIFSREKKFPPLQDDIIFTHEGISGPLAYKISSICAREEYSKESPLSIKLNFVNNPPASDLSLLTFQGMLNANPKKDVKNLVAELVPKSLAEYILGVNGIDLDVKCCNVNGKTRDLILKSLQKFEITVISPAKDGEIVTSGGVCLDEINPKTMQSKLVEGLYFCGEVIDADGLCGGFNLQNCWSTGIIAGISA